ncbi:MAG: aminotransferase class V-fold PLP-dependent enzyme [Vulcanimicrobiaceae bacterium]
MNPPLDRADFDVTNHLNYLNHAAVGVLPVRTRDALTKFVNDHASGGVLGTYRYEDNLPSYRDAVGSFVGASGREIALLRNTGDGANVLAAGLSWEPGDEILTNDNEFPANAYPWLAAQHFGASVRLLNTNRDRMTPDVLRAQMTDRTRVVSVSWVGFNDGYRHDLAALAEVAHERNALFCVDVIQGLGAFPLDVRACNVDAAYGGGAKWLMALQGVSFLYVRESLIDQLRVASPGWRSANDMWDFLNYEQRFIDNASRFEGGTPNIVGALSLNESIAVLKGAGTAIAAHVLSLTDHLCAGLEALGAQLSTVRGPGVSSGIVTFEVPGCNSIALGKLLQKERIVTTYRPSGIRVAPHGYTTLKEIDHLLEVTAQAVPALRSA